MQYITWGAEQSGDGALGLLRAEVLLKLLFLRDYLHNKVHCHHHLVHLQGHNIGAKPVLQPFGVGSCCSVTTACIPRRQSQPAVQEHPTFQAFCAWQASPLRLSHPSG